MRYSVIIPVYNAEKTIRRCLDSLLNQPHEDVELIVVNDGSTDDSTIICKEYAAKYRCIRYFEKENGGVSSARNMGLNNAQGDYILFVDSDDYVAQNYFEVITQALEEHRPQLLHFGIQDVGVQNKSWSLGKFYLDDPLKIAKEIRRAVKKCLFFNLLSKVFERKLIETHGIRFNENISIGEDLAFGFIYVTHVQTLASITDTLYFLAVENEESLSRKKRENLAEQLLLVGEDLYEGVKKTGHDNKTEKVYMDTVVLAHYRYAYSACKELLKFDMSTTQRKERIRQICSMYALPHMKPRSLAAIVISFPVIRRKVSLINWIVCFRNL